MAAIVQRLERQIVVLDVEGSIPSSRPIYLFPHEIFWHFYRRQKILYCLST